MRSPWPPRPLFLLLLTGHLAAAGLVRCNLRTSEWTGVALQWTLVLVCGAWAFKILATYRRTSWRKQKGGFDRIFLASLAAAIASAAVLFALHWTVPCEPYEVERYARGLMLSVTVYLFANTAIIFLLISLVYLLCARLATSITIGLAVALVLNMLHVAKYVVLQQHLYTWDYLLTGDLIEILPLQLGSTGMVVAGIVSGAAVVGIGLLAWREHPRETLGRRTLLFAGGLAATALLLLLSSIDTAGDDEDPSEYFPLWNRHSYNAYHNKCGLYFTLLRGSLLLGVNHAPPGYSEEAMARIARTYPRTTNDVVPTADVIFYMVESLADLTLHGLSYREDPIPNFHAIVREHGGGRLVVPIYGGNTPNTEFEILTGLSRVRPWPHDLAYAYRQWITEKTAALPWVFRDWGYHTAVVAGATSKIFGEKEAYPRLGFEAFHALGDREGLPRMFGLVSDEAVVDEVISILSEADAQDSTGQRRPCFLAITTDSTHGPYGGERIQPDARFALTDKATDPIVRDYALHYGHALNHADQALGRLVAFLRDRNKPAILFCYGDHKPAMGDLVDAGVFRSGWPNSVVDKYSTPLAIWSNLPPTANGKHGQPSDEHDRRPLLLSANFLAMELFARLGVRHPPSTFHYTAEVYKSFPVVSRVIMDREGRFYRPEHVQEELEAAQRSESAALLRDYGFIKYDVLVGRRAK